MKKSAKIFSTLFFILVLAVPFSASAETTAGIKPDSFFYSLDLLGEKISLFFTRDPYEKAKKSTLFADERIAEIKASGDNQKAAIKAVNEYTKDISRSFESFDNIKDDAKKTGFLISFENRYKEHWGTLVSLYESLPDEQQPVFREEKLGAYTDKLLKSVNELQAIVDKKSETTTSGADSKNVSDELADIKKQLALLEKQQGSRTDNNAISKPLPLPAEIRPSVTTQNKKTLESDDIYELVAPGVVFIKTKSGSGSGMFIEQGKFILTNAHVVEGPGLVSIKTNDGEILTGNVIGRDEYVDVALIKPVSSKSFPSVELGDSDSLKQGQKLYVFGYPLGLGGTPDGEVTFTEGVFSARQTIDGVKYIQTDASIHGGNSGGPLVSNKGQVIGINTLATQIKGGIGGVGLGFALPTNLIRGLIPLLKDGRNVVAQRTSPIEQESPNSPPQQPKNSTPEPKPEPVRTTISNVIAKEESYGVVISWDSNKSSIYGGWRALIGKQSDLSDAVELKPGYKSVTYSTTEPDTTYYYQVVVKDGCTQCLSYDSEEAKSQILSIHTKPKLFALSINGPVFETTYNTQDVVVVGFVFEVSSDIDMSATNGDPRLDFTLTGEGSSIPLTMFGQNSFLLHFLHSPDYTPSIEFKPSTYSWFISPNKSAKLTFDIKWPDYIKSEASGTLTVRLKSVSTRESSTGKSVDIKITNPIIYSKSFPE